MASQQNLLALFFPRLGFKMFDFFGRLAKNFGHFWMARFGQVFFWANIRTCLVTEGTSPVWKVTKVFKKSVTKWISAFRCWWVHFGHPIHGMHGHISEVIEKREISLGWCLIKTNDDSCVAPSSQALGTCLCTGETNSGFLARFYKLNNVFFYHFSKWIISDTRMSRCICK